MNKYQMIRVVAAYPVVYIGNVKKNCDEILKLSKEWDNNNVDIAVFPELCLTGYTCADLFYQSTLIQDVLLGLNYLTKHIKSTVIVGLPLSVNGNLYNCAAVIEPNKIIGIVPKTFLPNYKEFYEKRWFTTPQPNDPQFINISGNSIPFGNDILFSTNNFPEFKFSVELCEDCWQVIPPASFQAISGANLIFNLSASNETVTKVDYRREMIKQASGRYVSGYVYCSSGPTESTADVVFGGHCIIAENGNLLVETKRFKDQDWIMSDIDIEKLLNSRRKMPTFADNKRYLNKNFVTHNCNNFLINNNTIVRKVNPLPFVPSNSETLKSRCEDIFNIQICALSKRLQQVGQKNYSIGISGGLDSTLAALVVHKAFKRLEWNPKLVNAITMPGFGTSQKTLNNSLNLMDQLGFNASIIDIKDLCIQTFRDINHNPFGIYPTANWDTGQIMESGRFVDNLKNIETGSKDLIFENVQARVRTLILMSKGFVFGTGDMSELALGWCTYNGDHMSMYNVNCSIPKTLIKFLVKYVADNEVAGELQKTLLSICDTTISPELLPLSDDGTISQSTEDSIGPYELHDFFLYHFESGLKPDKILALAKIAFTYEENIIIKWLKVFLTRFFAMQFKRECVPNGPKVGTVSLSCRGDLRLPPEIDCEGWLNDI